MTQKLVTLDTKDNISIITIDDGKANVFSSTMIEDFNKCLDQVPRDNGALIIKGRDGILSGGFDLKIISSGDMKAIHEMTLSGFRLLSRILSFPRPVIAACTGHAIALGTFMLCCCDYRIGAKGDFMIGANEMRTNMVIPIPILELIKFRVSQRHKYRAILGAEMYSIDAAVEAGLMDKAVEEKKLMEEALLKAEDLAAMGHPSYSLTKELLINDVVTKINNALDEIDAAS